MPVIFEVIYSPYVRLGGFPRARYAHGEPLRVPIGTGASFTLGVSPVNLGYLLPLVITLGSYKLSRQFVIVPLIFSDEYHRYYVSRKLVL